MYFNFSTHWPSNGWERNGFLRAWRSLYAADPRWVPPDHGALKRLVQGKLHPFYAALQTQPVYLEALPQRNGPTTYNPNAPIAAGAAFEEPVAAALVQIDPRRHDGTAYLSLLHCANDEETLERLLGKVVEFTAESGCGRLVGPVGVTPNWQPGALASHFHLAPPLHTPYNPPYLSEVLGTTMEPCLEQTLFAVAVPGQVAAGTGPATLEALNPARLAGDLLPLLAAALENEGVFPGSDQAEAEALLAWLRAYPLVGRLATVDGQPAGFVLLQPDLAAQMRMFRGGRGWVWGALAARRKRGGAKAGRLLLGAVGPRWRGRGIGRQLWGQALIHAREMGWESVTAGPFARESAGARFLAAQGASAQQRYVTYEWGL